ncbi:MAG: hypothetical protein HGA49_10145, partial [Eubacteriaceae bacterium]|nr:hypothetical protein [Eubacteriaceae bacterium]
KEKINELEMHLNINALSSIEKVLVKNYLNEELSIEDVIVYFTKFFIKIMYGKDVLSRHQIKEYAKKFIELSDYSTVDIYQDFLCDR